VRSALPDIGNMSGEIVFIAPLHRVCCLPSESVAHDRLPSACFATKVAGIHDVHRGSAGDNFAVESIRHAYTLISLNAGRPLPDLHFRSALLVPTTSESAQREAAPAIVKL
jgi:hypothetical protein